MTKIHFFYTFLTYLKFDLQRQVLYYIQIYERRDGRPVGKNRKKKIVLSANQMFGFFRSSQDTKKLREFVEYMNWMYPSIQFTIENESDISI